MSFGLWNPWYVRIVIFKDLISCGFYLFVTDKAQNGAMFGKELPKISTKEEDSDGGEENFLYFD